MYKIGNKTFKSVKDLSAYSVVDIQTLYKRLSANPPWRVEDAISYLPHESPKDSRDRILFLHKTGLYTMQMISDITGTPYRTVRHFIEKNS